MHPSTFDYLMPSEEQELRMQVMRANFKNLADAIYDNVPDGPDKTYIMRKLREVAMWVNVSITRNPDGSPRA